MPERGSSRRQFGMMSGDLIAALDAEAAARSEANPDQRRVTRREVAEEKLRAAYGLPPRPVKARKGTAPSKVTAAVTGPARPVKRAAAAQAVVGHRPTCRCAVCRPPKQGKKA